MTEDRTPHRNGAARRWRRAGIAVTLAGALVASTVVALPVSPARITVTDRCTRRVKRPHQDVEALH